MICYLLKTDYTTKDIKVFLIVCYVLILLNPWGMFFVSILQGRQLWKLLLFIFDGGHSFFPFQTMAIGASSFYVDDQLLMLMTFMAKHE